jgi:hypothetical protein
MANEKAWYIITSYLMLISQQGTWGGGARARVRVGERRLTRRQARQAKSKKEN